MTFWIAITLVITVIGMVSCEENGYQHQEEAPFDKNCFEIPIMWITPKTPLPTQQCIQNSLPAGNCMKERIAATILIVNNANKSLNCLSDNATEKTFSHVNYRGDSSLMFEKHQLSVILDEPVSLLGFPTDTHWALHGPYVDGSLMRNHLAHWLYRNTGRYSPRTRHVVLYITGTDNKPSYKGYYLFMEHISYGPNRVGLAENTANCSTEEINGGWAWQLNPLSFGVYSPNAVNDMYQELFGGGMRSVLEYPLGEQTSQKMRNFFVNTTTGFLPRYYRYLYSDMATSPKGIDLHIDIGSYVDYMLHSEMSLNQDAYRRSAFFFKDRNEPINAGPVWDFNLAYGNGANAIHGNEWLFYTFLPWKRLIANYKIAGLFVQRWKQLRQHTWSDYNVTLFINQSTVPFFSMFHHCKDWMSKELQCAHVSGINRGTYSDQVNKLIAAVIARARWMDANIETVYQQLEYFKFGNIGSIPTYNCGEDPNDSGCLQEPGLYYKNISFPKIHTPYSGTQCNNHNKSKSYRNSDEQSALNSSEPSIDPCWLSVGTYVTAGYITPTCSGFGHCDEGPNGKCHCNNGMSTPNCVPVAEPVQLNAETDGSKHGLWAHPWNATMLLLLVSLATLCGSILVSQFRYKKYETGSQKLFSKTKLHYGT